MAKKDSGYLCSQCGAKFPKWTGKCGHCGEWDTLVEEEPIPAMKGSWVSGGNQPTLLGSIPQTDKDPRWKTNVYEFDRVLGGGFVPGSFGLLGGTPGVGKSTLILQLLGRLVKIGKKVLYVSGEESAAQLKQRASRLLVTQDEILILIECSVENVLHYLHELKPDFVVIDSIQTLFTESLSAGPGSVTQVRESANILMKHAKGTGSAVLLVGHVTKDGDIAGPRTLEHMVDYVLYLEGEKKEQQRILRAVKNRFGTIAEVGLFKMTAKGLAEVSKPNQLFVDKFTSSHSGMAVFAANEGSRTLFLEIQVLVGETLQRNPARTCIGVERNRLLMVVAVLEKHLQLDFSGNDIYVNLAEGFRVVEPAMDMAVTAALLSSHLLKPLPPRSVFFGELALTGEFRETPATAERVHEATRCGFEHIYLPASAVNKRGSLPDTIELVPIATVSQLIDRIQ